MKKILTIILLLFALTSQAQISDALISDTITLWIVPGCTKCITAAKLNSLLNHLNDSKLNKDSIANVWTLTGDDIENNNAGDVTINGQVFVPDIMASGTKYSGNVAGIGLDDRLFPKSIVELYDEIIDTLKYLNRNFANYASVKDFGAVGDGLTDDTQAFQNAIDSNSTVFVPKGVYLLTGINMYTGTQLIGENRDSSILKLETTPTDALITIDNAGEWTSGVSIQNLTLKHRNSYSPTSYYGTLIRMDSVIHISVNHCTLTEFSNFGILITNSGSTGDNVLSVDIDNNLFYDSDASAIKLSTEGEYVAIRTNRFNEIRAAALYSDGAGNTLFTGNMANHCGSSSYYVVDVRYAYTQANGGKVNITNNNFNHNISGSKGAIGYIMNASTGNMSYFGAIITGNNFLGIVADSAIVTLKASDCIVSNNLFWAVNAGTECIWIADYSGTQLSAHNVITGNINLNSTVFCRNTSTSGAQIVNNNYDRASTTDYGLQSDQSGNWAIGSLTDADYRLTVEGNLYAEKISVNSKSAPAYTLSVTGTGFFADDLTLDDNMGFVGAGTISTTGNGTMTLDVGTGKVDVSGDLDYDLSHGYMYYYERSETIALTQNVYTKLTKSGNNLFTIDEANGITIAGDSITITRAGDYTLWFIFSGTGAGTNDVYRFKLYKNGAAILGTCKASAAKADVINVWHIQDLAAGDDLSIYLTNTIDNDDVTAVDCSIYIRKDHD